MNDDARLKIDKAIEEIEHYVSEAHRIPLLERVAIKDDELFHLMDNLRSEIPKEVDEALCICSRRDEIIGAAQAEAEKIIARAHKEAEDIEAKAEGIVEDARQQALRIVDENVLVRQAQDHARGLTEEAEAKAKELRESAEAQTKELKETTEAEVQRLREQTEAYVLQLKADAEHYADQLFDHVLANMTSAMNAINNDVGSVMQAMQQAKEQIHGSH